ncbi:MAG: hypothetical protein K8H75_05120, partial [Sulfuricella sp.]|nr:hypothetical protein [Sulfuricella sp.]
LPLPLQLTRPSHLARNTQWASFRKAVRGQTINFRHRLQSGFAAYFRTVPTPAMATAKIFWVERRVTPAEEDLQLRKPSGSGSAFSDSLSHIGN